jgi:hypothetical protein
MDNAQVMRIVNLASAMIMRNLLTIQFTSQVSLMMMLASKEVLQPADVLAFAKQTADILSQSLREGQEGLSKEVNDALQFYVDELLKMSEIDLSGKSPPFPGMSFQSLP